MSDPAGDKRIPIPDGLTVDRDQTLLPTRAVLKSFEALLIPARRHAVTSTSRRGRRVISETTDPDRHNIAALAAAWEAIAALELAANIAAAWVDPVAKAESGPWVQMTRWDGGRATRFYESSKNWPVERYGVLSMHYFEHGDDTSFLELMRDTDVQLPPGVLAAWEEAQEATARFLRRQVGRLARAWAELGPLAAAYEHGLLHIPSEVSRVTDGSDAEVTHPILLWKTRKPESHGLTDSVSEILDYAADAGLLALDLAEYVCESRLGLIDAVELQANGAPAMNSWDNPFQWWFDRGDVSESTLAVLASGVRLGWEPDLQFDRR